MAKGIKSGTSKVRTVPGVKVQSVNKPTTVTQGSGGKTGSAIPRGTSAARDVPGVREMHVHKPTGVTHHDGVAQGNRPPGFVSEHAGLNVKPGMNQPRGDQPTLGK